MASGDGDEDEDAPSAESAVSLARVLRTLKRQGSNLLVVGLTAEEGCNRICNRMLGEDTAGPRRRLLVVTGADPESLAEQARRAQRPPADTTRYITYTASARKASEGEREEKPSGSERTGDRDGADDGDEGRNVNNDRTKREDTLPGSRHVEAGQLAELGDVIENEIDAIEEESDGLVPAELRVCLDSLTPLLDVHDRSAVLRFLDRVTTRVKASNGMGHVHLPVARDWEGVSGIEGPFDAVVELRAEQGRTQQRWHLRNADITSDWFPV